MRTVQIGNAGRVNRMAVPRKGCLRARIGARLAGAVMFLVISPSLSFALEETEVPIATKATCGPNDRPESGLQGQTTLAERFASGEPRAFNCNLELVGEDGAEEGAAYGLAIHDKCAYLPRWHDVKRRTVLDPPGTAVIDLSNPAGPKRVQYLTTGGMENASESVITQAESNLLIGFEYDNVVDNATNELDIYDVSDCANPVLKYSGILPGLRLHTGGFSPDGKTFYTGNCCFNPKGAPSDGNSLQVLDISNPSDPKLIAEWLPPNEEWKLHQAAVGDDGKTLYLSTISPSPNHGLIILDVSEVQARKREPKIRMLGSLFISRGFSTGQFTHPLMIQGRKYAYLTAVSGTTLSSPNACREGLPAFGYTHMIDVEDPKNPKKVSGLKLEVHDPANCSAVMHDPTFGGYGATFCDVDNYQYAKMMVCGFSEGGVRVFDIRNVKQPREIAYYKPKAAWASPRFASWAPTFWEDTPEYGPRRVHTADRVTMVYFANDRKEVWFSSLDGGFKVVRFSEALMEREKELFAEPLCPEGQTRSRRGCVR